MLEDLIALEMFEERVAEATDPEGTRLRRQIEDGSLAQQLARAEATAVDRLLQRKRATPPDAPVRLARPTPKVER
jgi:hypothetical protein